MCERRSVKLQESVSKHRERDVRLREPRRGFSPTPNGRELSESKRKKQSCKRLYSFVVVCNKIVFELVCEYLLSPISCIKRFTLTRQIQWWNPADVAHISRPKNPRKRGEAARKEKKKDSKEERKKQSNCLLVYWGAFTVNKGLHLASIILMGPPESSQPASPIYGPPEHPQCRSKIKKLLKLASFKKVFTLSSDCQMDGIRAAQYGGVQQLHRINS